MIKVAITQRVEKVNSYEERRDCIDQRWASLLETLSIDILQVPNGLIDTGGWLKRHEVQGLILTGGNDLSYLLGASNPSKERDLTEAALLTAAKDINLPVLGVCRGMQMINFWFGGSMIPIASHVATTHAVTALIENQWFSKSFMVNSYHSWGFMPEHLATDLLPIVQAEDGTVEAFKHTSLPWFGIMWHPERNLSFSQQDQELIKSLFIEY